MEKFMDGRGEPWDNWVEKFLEFGWERHILLAGDFYFTAHDGKTVGIESKQVSDIASRLKDARRELAQLIDTRDISILIMWGKWNRLSNDTILGGQDQLTWGHLWNLLETYQDAGLRIQLATSRDHAFQRINQLYAYYQRSVHTGAIAERRASADRRIASLMCIPGISVKLGKSLLHTFNSLRDVANASEVELEGASLIGGTKAKAIKDWFERIAPYR